MLSEKNLGALDSLVETGESVFVHPDTLRQLVAAARVANAAAHRRRCRWDGWRGGNKVHIESADYACSRALDRYTQPQPQKVNA